MRTEDFFDKIEVPVDLESRLENLIDHLAEEEKQSKNKIRQMRWWISGLAAGIAILITLGVIFRNPYQDSSQLTAQTTGISEDQKKQCLEAQKALVLVSLNFNRGIDKLVLVSNKLEKSNNRINKIFK